MSLREYDLDEFKKRYPNLYMELIEGKARILSVRINYSSKSADPWTNYEPNVVDFIRRARTVEEALEVVDFLERIGEISRDEAERYRRILNEKGLSAFGPRKRDGYYLIVAGYATS